MTANNISRRSMIKKTASTTLAFTFLPPYLALGKADAQGNLPPSQRINLGCIAVGGRANGVIPGLSRSGFAKPVAFCDVDFSAKRSENNLKDYRDLPRFADFRIMLDEMGDDIDAVSVCTPDHTHYVATLEAMRRGKHVYVEKPLTHSFREAEMLMKASEKYDVVTQMGNQGHTSIGSAQFQQLIDCGAIKDIVKIEAFKLSKSRNADKGQYPEGEQVPDSLNWDLWCGPAVKMPFSRSYHQGGWRSYYQYGNGALGDWGSHLIDFAHEYLKLGLPTRLEAIEMTDHNNRVFPTSTSLRMKFPERSKALPACDLYWLDGPEEAKPEAAKRYWTENADGSRTAPTIGKAGTYLHRKDGKFLIQRGSHGDISRIYPRKEMYQYREFLKAPAPKFDHYESFVQACMGNGETTSPFKQSGELTQALMLGIICQYLNESFDFDPESKRSPNNSKVNSLLEGPEPRKGWEDYYHRV